MRIIGGRAKGRTLKTLGGYDVRPTPDKVRESLFQRLGDLRGLCFLDGFAGSGAVGIEALSREASTVVFVESSRRACQCIKDNLERAGFSDDHGWKTLPLLLKTGATGKGLMGQHDEEGRNWMLLPLAMMRAISHLERTGEVFDIIFLDPPYRSEAGLVVLKRLAGSPLLSRDGRLVWEHATGRQLEIAEVVGWRIMDTRRFGDTEITELACSK